MSFQRPPPTPGAPGFGDPARRRRPWRTATRPSTGSSADESAGVPETAGDCAAVSARGDPGRARGPGFRASGPSDAQRARPARLAGAGAETEGTSTGGRDVVDPVRRGRVPVPSSPPLGPRPLHPVLSPSTPDPSPPASQEAREAAPGCSRWRRGAAASLSSLSGTSASLRSSAAARRARRAGRVAPSPPAPCLRRCERFVRSRTAIVPRGRPSARRWRRGSSRAIGFGTRRRDRAGHRGARDGPRYTPSARRSTSPDDVRARRVAGRARRDGKFDARRGGGGHELIPSTTDGASARGRTRYLRGRARRRRSRSASSANLAKVAIVAFLVSLPQPSPRRATWRSRRAPRARGPQRPVFLLRRAWHASRRPLFRGVVAASRRAFEIGVARRGVLSGCGGAAARAPPGRRSATASVRLGSRVGRAAARLPRSPCVGRAVPGGGWGVRPFALTWAQRAARLARGNDLWLVFDAAPDAPDPGDAGRHPGRIGIRRRPSPHRRPRASMLRMRRAPRGSGISSAAGLTRAAFAGDPGRTAARVRAMRRRSPRRCPGPCRRRHEPGVSTERFRTSVNPRRAGTHARGVARAAIDSGGLRVRRSAAALGLVAELTATSAHQRRMGAESPSSASSLGARPGTTARDHLGGLVAPGTRRLDAARRNRRRRRRRLDRREPRLWSVVAARDGHRCVRGRSVPPDRRG